MGQIDQEASRKDIAIFLNDRKTISQSPVSRSLFWETKYPHFLIARILSFYGLRRRYFSLREFLRLQLPARFKSPDLRDKFSSFLNKEAKKLIENFINSDGSVIYNGHRFYPPGENYYELFGLFFELIVADQYQAKRFLKEDSVVIDAGANIGTFSVFAISLVPEGNIYAFEPVQKTFEILKKNTAPFSAISDFKNGLGDICDTKEIMIYSGSTGGNTFKDSGLLEIRHHHSEEMEKERVEVTTIDIFVAEKNIPRIDFIKIDTEGYEAKILQGARETIKKWRPVIAMSAYHNPGDREELPRLLKEICPAYTCEFHHDYEKVFICHVQ
jgi:FkbM family methyltransferase